MRVPFMIFDPKAQGEPRRIDTPVSLLDVFPTLVGMTGVRSPAHELEGVNLEPVLEGDSRERGRPVVSTLYRGFHSVRSDRYRLIRYPDGTRELYDLKKDEWEWTNLAADKRYDQLIDELESWIPSEEEQKAEHVDDSK